MEGRGLPPGLAPPQADPLIRMRATRTNREGDGDSAGEVVLESAMSRVRAGPESHAKGGSDQGSGRERHRALQAADEVEEGALVVVAHVGQVVGEVGEVVADAHLHVVADVTIDRAQRAAAAL